MPKLTKKNYHFTYGCTDGRTYGWTDGWTDPNKRKASLSINILTFRCKYLNYNALYDS